MPIVFYVVVALVVAFFAAALRVLREYERAVMFTLGRFTGVMGPGLMIMVSVIQQMVRVDLRTRVLDVPQQDVISRDNVSVRVNAVVYYRVMQPDRSVIQVEDFNGATSQLAQIRCAPSWAGMISTPCLQSGTSSTRTCSVSSTSERMPGV
jgi:regulator of protease activity HflC (stomatin/prohibitin superfamily)